MTPFHRLQAATLLIGGRLEGPTAEARLARLLATVEQLGRQQERLACVRTARSMGAQDVAQALATGSGEPKGRLSDDLAQRSEQALKDAAGCDADGNAQAAQWFRGRADGLRVASEKARAREAGPKQASPNAPANDASFPSTKGGRESVDAAPPKKAVGA